MEEASVSFQYCCIICKLGFDSTEPGHVTEKGLLTLLSYSEKHERKDLCAYLNHSADTNCFESMGDKLISEVEQHLLPCIDLVAAEAIYHVQCYSLFMLLKKISKRKV